MNKNTEELLEEMTKLTPERLSPEAYKLWSKICHILDENEQMHKYKERCLGVLEFIDSRKEGLCPDIYEDLRYIVTQSEGGEW